MSTQLTTRLMPAQNTNPIPKLSSPDLGSPGEGVKAVAIFESRQARSKRAWDELSELDRVVLLESVRQRRRAQQEKAELYTALHGLRSNR